jgi:phosphatidylserine decarboxylase
LFERRAVEPMSISDRAHSRIHNTLPVAKEGLPFILFGFALFLLFLYLKLAILAILTLAATLFTIYFFRDPERRSKADERAVLVPADGRVLKIQHLDEQDNPLGVPAVKASVFMSLFDVHVNRIPVSGRISEITYHPGKFFAANRDKASAQNENNSITLETRDGQRIVFIQIAGLVARRIACWIKEGDEVQAGQRFGLIRFGSRLDIYLPGNSRILAQRDHKVRAGETILGYLS